MITSELLADIRMGYRSEELSRERGRIAYELHEREGWSYPKIGKFLNCWHSAVVDAAKRYAKREGLPITIRKGHRGGRRPTKIHDHDLQDIYDRYQKGETLASIAATYHVYYGTVSNALDRYARRELARRQAK